MIKFIRDKWRARQARLNAEALERVQKRDALIDEWQKQYPGVDRFIIASALSDSPYVALAGIRTLQGIDARRRREAELRRVIREELERARREAEVKTAAGAAANIERECAGLN